MLAELDAIEEITFVGYPNALHDKVTGLPIARRGHTATPAYLPFDGEKVFLIDGSVFGGSSGSPVFYLAHGIRADRRGNAILGSQTLLLGVLAAVLTEEQEGRLVREPIPSSTDPRVFTPQMMDLGIVYRSSLIMEIINPLIDASPPP